MLLEPCSWGSQRRRPGGRTKHHALLKDKGETGGRIPTSFSTINQCTTLGERKCADSASRHLRRTR